MKHFILVSISLAPIVAAAAPGSYSGNIESDPGSSVSIETLLIGILVLAVVVGVVKFLEDRAFPDLGEKLLGFFMIASVVGGLFLIALTFFE